LIDYLVGTGGWSYFNVPNKSKLRVYSGIFNFVEVNYTFYEYPTVQTVERWRRTVPKDFTFSVRCHQDLTHKIGLKPIDETYEVFYKSKTYADILQTPYVVLETPKNYVINNFTKDFLSSLNLKSIKLVWEYRASVTPEVTNLMRDFNIMHCVDLSIQKPSFNLDVTYSRLFGKGQHNIYQFTDDELVEIQHKAEETNSKQVILAYHGLRMNGDALRFQKHLETGNFLPVTSATGVDSAKAVLAEDVTFPTSKSELIKKQGWKVIDVKQNQTAHLSEFLKSIPDKNYSNISEVVKELEVVIGQK
jgi:uncharacterized protein YecE (DUF72 family)